MSNYRTKTQKKNALKAIKIKAAKLALPGPFAANSVISMGDYEKIRGIVDRALKKL